VGAYIFTVSVSPDFLAAASKFLVMSSGDKSLIVETTVSSLDEPFSTSAP
jgi:hypothetical protein